MREQEAIEKYWIKKLVALTAFLGDQDIADILLVWAGFKPAALFELSYLSRARVSRAKFYQMISDLKKIFRKLELKYYLQLNYPKMPQDITRYSFVAKDQSTLKRIIAASAEKNSKIRRLKLGALLGYPKTAVYAFANGASLDPCTLPASILKMSATKFLNFRLSRHWKKELQYIQRRARAIKKISPELYRRIAGKFSDYN